MDSTKAVVELGGVFALIPKAYHMHFVFLFMSGLLFVSIYFGVFCDAYRCLKRTRKILSDLGDEARVAEEREAKRRPAAMSRRSDAPLSLSEIISRRMELTKASPLSASLFMCLLRTWHAMDPVMRLKKPPLTSFPLQSVQLISGPSPPYSIFRQDHGTFCKEHEKTIMDSKRGHLERVFASTLFTFLHKATIKAYPTTPRPSTFVEAIAFRQKNRDSEHRHWITFDLGKTAREVRFSEAFRPYIEVSSDVGFYTIPCILSISIKRVLIEASKQSGFLPCRLTDIPLKLAMNSKFYYLLKSVILRSCASPYHYHVLLRAEDSWILYTPEGATKISQDQLLGDSRSLLGEGATYVVYFLFYSRRENEKAE